MKTDEDGGWKKKKRKAEHEVSPKSGDLNMLV